MKPMKNILTFLLGVMVYYIIYMGCALFNIEHDFISFCFGIIFFGILFAIRETIDGGW